MWTKMRPVMHGLADMTDTWERFAKYVYFYKNKLSALMLR
jgi:hypothetical protein